MLVVWVSFIGPALLVLIVGSALEYCCCCFLYILKICILGDVAVGKTSLVKKFAEKVFVEEYAASTGEKHIDAVIPVDAHQYKVGIT